MNTAAASGTSRRTAWRPPDRPAGSPAGPRSSGPPVTTGTSGTLGLGRVTDLAVTAIGVWIRIVCLGIDVRDRVSRLLGGDRVGLVIQQDVAFAAGERLQGGAGTGVLDADVLGQQRPDVGEGVRGCFALLELGAVPARMFQRALPDVDGFGVITSTPDLIKWSQPVMCLGLPLRTTMHDHRVARDALLRVGVPARSRRACP